MTRQTHVQAKSRPSSNCTLEEHIRARLTYEPRVLKKIPRGSTLGSGRSRVRVRVGVRARGHVRLAEEPGDDVYVATVKFRGRAESASFAQPDGSSTRIRSADECGLVL